MFDWGELLGLLPAHVVGCLRVLLDEPPLAAADLRGRLTVHLARVESSLATNEFLDLKLARSLVDRCLRLLERLDHDATDEQRRLIQAACRYFTLDRDADQDTTELLGFDDDALVLAAVEQELRQMEGP